MGRNRATHLAVIAIAIAWCFDQLFWMKVPGISFFIFVLIFLGGGAYLSWQAGVRPARRSLVLLGPILLFSSLTFFRQEPFTLLFDMLLAVGLLGVLAATWQGGQWARFSLADYVVNSVRLGFRVLTDPPQFFAAPPDRDATDRTEGANAGDPARAIKPVLVGLFLALPIVAFLAVLLASADPIFADRLGSVLALLRLEKLGEYLFRLFYIGVGAYLLSGVYLYSLLRSRDVKLLGEEEPWLPPFLGWVEGVIVLLSVDALFLLFVLIQLQYFFGGQENISQVGYTYSEYARRGFGELVVVALTSLLLFLGLSAISRREGRLPRRLFSGLGAGLVLLVGVFLISAFQRLLLYERAYGFTRLRTHTHVFIIWLGVLLLATVGLELAGRLRGFGLALVVAGLGFALSINLINVDGLIAAQNIQRARGGSELDTAYLMTLSTDAVPILEDRYRSTTGSPGLQDAIGVVLACRSAMERARPAEPWPSFHWSGYRARRIYQQLQDALSSYSATESVGRWMVTVRGEERPCPGN